MSLVDKYVSNNQEANWSLHQGSGTKPLIPGPCTQDQHDTLA